MAMPPSSNPLAHWPARYVWTACAVVLAHAAALWGLHTDGPGRPPAAPPEPAVVMAATLVQAAAAAHVAMPSAQATPAAHAKPATAPARVTPRQTAPPPRAKPPSPAQPQAAARPATSSPAAATTPAAPSPPQIANPISKSGSGHPSDSDTTPGHSTAATTSPTPSGPSPTASGNTTSAAPSAQAQVELPNASASYLNNPKPPYPALSKRLGEEGKVVLRVWIDTSGAATQAEVQTSSGYDRLDQTALQTVLNWRYIPGKRAGVPAAMWFHIPLNFVLE